MHEWAHSLGRDNDLWLHLYGSSSLETELAGDRLSLIQSTGYPWSGQVTCEVLHTPPDAWPLRLRIPEWAEGTTLQVNRQRVEDPVEPGTYAAVTRIWAPGDIVEPRLPMTVRLVQAHPRVEAARNQVAVMLGPSSMAWSRSTCRRASLSTRSRCRVTPC